MLRVTQLTNYGIIVLERLASAPKNTHLSSRDLAAQLELPLTITAKILKSLTRHGILLSHRGINGGYELARSADTISVAEIVTALEGPLPGQGNPTTIHPCDFINRTIHQTLIAISLPELATSLQLPMNREITPENITHSESSEDLSQ